jgi:Ala-tRNA(Pro) deacylase
MPATRLKKFLDENNVKYLSIQHSPAFTAQEMAAKMHIHGWELAKTVILKADGKLVMAVLPAPMMVDLNAMRDVLAVSQVALATEDEFRGRFPECDLGAMPPFGHLFEMPLYAEARLSRDPSIVFPAGTHTEAIRMDYRDFERLARPSVASFAVLEKVGA